MGDKTHPAARIGEQQLGLQGVHIVDGAEGHHTAEFPADGGDAALVHGDDVLFLQLGQRHHLALGQGVVLVHGQHPGMV